MDKLLKKLNAAQREAVYHQRGPLLILAGAGSGKTTTMATRIAYLVAKHRIRGENILGLSFTRKAAGELKERVEKMIAETSGPEFAKGLTLSTFHALCVRILRARASEIGYSPDFTILDEKDQGDIVKSILRQMKLDDRKFDADLIKFEIGQAKNRFYSPDQARDFFLESGRLPEDYAIAAANVYEHYQERLAALNAFDFDDLLFQAVRLLEKSDAAREFYNRKFQYILVDEYQDTNPSQFRLLRLLTESHDNICVVGDDDQSIYAWRGADPTHILEFGKHYPGARTITLDQNYRSTSTILDAANEVITKNRKRHPKRLWSENGQGEPITNLIVEEDRAEAETVAEEILRRRENPDHPRRWQDFAVLYRSNPQSRLFEEALRMRKIPYKIVGTLSYLDRREVKDTLSYWRVIQNPKDDASFRRICNWPARGFGKTTLEAINTSALANGTSLFEACEEAVKDDPNGENLSAAKSPGLSPKAVAAVRAFIELIRGMRADLDSTPLDRSALSDWGKRTLAKIRVKETLLEEEKDDPALAERRWENALELANALGQVDIEGARAETAEYADLASGAKAALRASAGDLTTVGVLSKFLQAMTLDPNEDDDEDDTPKDEVTLLTLHGSKGLEFPVVFMVGAEEGYLPHQRTIDGTGPEAALGFDEERRLAYVGITRAKTHLVISRAKFRVRYGKKVPRLPSRFLEDIPKSLLLVQDESEAPEPTTAEAKEAHEAKVKDFMASLRSRLQGTP
ncbi:MAG: UvrD-helicase domain-containing protein [Bdellovibrionales bacterium]|nr:UvrD-helicase domain-containing protein [Bdellovibrionales bacterium]